MLATSKSLNNIPNLSANAPSDLVGLRLWAILAFQAGWINGGGFVACKRFVTHTTGFATQFGYDLAAANWTDAAAMLSIPLFFLCGAMIGAYFVDRPVQLNQKPKFHVLFFLISLFLLTATVFGTMDAFGPFGHEPQFLPAYILIALLCISSGIQNACSTTASKSYVRTTHLTGYTTDLGISFVRLMSLSDKEKIQLEISQNKIRLTVMLTFIFGTAVSSFIFIRSGYIGFIFPAVISAVLFIIAKREFSSHG
ncbi:MAG: hypothetical protein K0R29_1381 [Pseudobdellovibrio sp.]|nr:hypothetical protein [Pseudobdellovibrio sp.]